MKARAKASKNAREGDDGSRPASGDLCDTETPELGELFLALAENCPSMVFITQHGTVKYANPRCEKIMGYTRQEMYADGFRFLDMVAPDSRELVRRHLPKHLRGTRMPPCEYALLTKDGQRLVAVISTNRISFGGEAAVMGIVTDLTQRKEVEESLRVSEDRYRALFDTMLEGFALHEIILDDDGCACDYRFLVVNPSFEALTGLQSKDIIGKTVREIMPGIEPQWIETYGEVAKTGKAKRFTQYSKELDKHFEVMAYSPQQSQFATIFVDITEQKRAEKALAHRVRFERLLTDISSRFVSLAPDELDQGIADTLEALGAFTGVDRSFVYQFSPDRSQLMLTHQWAAEGVDMKSTDAQSVDADSLNWSVSQLLARKVLHVPDVDSLPLDASAEQALWQSEDVQGVLAVPLVCGASVMGALGFDSLWECREWDAHAIDIIRVVGEIFASALDRRRIEEELRDRLQFERLITSMSSQFVNLAPDEVDGAIDAALRDLGEFSGVDRGYVFRFHEDAGEFRRTHFWSADGVPPAAPEVTVPPDRAPWELGMIRRFEVIHVPRVSKLPPEAVALRAYMQDEGIKSMVCVPFTYGEAELGFLGFSSIHEEREWPEGIISVLRLVGEVFTGALKRRNVPA